MITLQDFNTTIANKDFAQCLDLFKKLRPDSTGQIRMIEQRKNLNGLLSLLENERSNSKVIKAAIDTIISYKQDEYGDTVEINEYPDYFPFMLQNLLIETNKLIKRKQELSNSLKNLKDKPSAAVQTCKEISELSEVISENFMIKYDFLKTGYLPDKLVNPVSNLSNDLDVLQKTLQSVQEKISKCKAKLKNPTELTKEGKARQWREEIKLGEAKRAALMDKIKILKTR